MLHADERFHSAVEEAVGRLEAKTDAEIIVVAAPKSGQYRDISLMTASLATGLMLLVLLLIPVDVHPWMLLPELVTTFLLVAWLSSASFSLRYLASKARKKRQVEAIAQAEFFRENVHATPHRTGVLVYVSAMEGSVHIIPDLGIEGRVPSVPWAQACSKVGHEDLDHFLAGLDAIGEVLERYVPALETDLVDLPNAPRVRS